MKLHTIFGVNIGTIFDYDGNSLVYITKLSQSLFGQLAKSMKKPGNILFIGFPKEIRGMFGGKIYEFSCVANYDQLHNFIVENLQPDQEIFVKGDFSEDSSTNSPEALRAFIEQNSIGIIVTRAVASEEISENFQDLDELHLFQDQISDGENVMENLRSWWVYCREMYFEDEYLKTFAGVQGLPLQGPMDPKRPVNGFSERVHKEGVK